MSRTYRRTAGLIVVAALASSALFMPAVSQAKSKSYKVKMVSDKGTSSGTKITANYAGKPFGKCKMKGTLVLPVSKQVWTCKGGSFKVRAEGGVEGSDFAGTWKISGGKGKFKGISGKGPWKGPLATSIFTYTGTAKY